VSVVEAVDDELGSIAGRDEALARSGLAAAARRLAELVDDPHTRPTAAAMCARELRECLGRLRELAPPEVIRDGLDDLAGRRARRRGTA
jgi:hypothetical protein